MGSRDVRGSAGSEPLRISAPSRESLRTNGAAQEGGRKRQYAKAQSRKASSLVDCVLQSLALSDAAGELMRNSDRDIHGVHVCGALEPSGELNSSYSSCQRS